MKIHWGALPDFARLTRLSLQNENKNNTWIFGAFG
jgi:hypothetical protein